MRHPKRDTPKGQSHAREGRDKKEERKRERERKEEGTEKSSQFSLMEAGGA